MSKRIIIIGGGFSGTMVAIQLIRNAKEPLHIQIITEGEKLNRGVAFSAYSTKHLLNVTAAQMSALPDEPNHFLDWAIQQPDYNNIDRNVLGHSFLPRHLYGQYLTEMWQFARIKAKHKEIVVEELDDRVEQLTPHENGWQVLLNGGKTLQSSFVVLATGNALPRNPQIINPLFFEESKNYFRNPWDVASVQNPPTHLPVLIIGNGLTMADTVIGLLENGLSERVISLSPHGFNLLPHRYSNIQYNKLIEELRPGMKLLDWLSLINLHRKRIRKLGLSAAPIIDSLRPIAWDIWRGLSIAERKIFMNKLRHLWGVARHRVPVQVHDLLVKLQLSQQLSIQSGTLIDLLDGGDFVRVVYWDKKTQSQKKFDVSRVINCTGPENDISKVSIGFFQGCLQSGIIKQDPLHLGIEATWPNLQVMSANGVEQQGLFAIGNLLRGLLWESTAVGELRLQAEMIAKTIVNYTKN